MLEMNVAITVVEQLNKQNNPLQLTVQEAMTMEKAPSDVHDVYDIVKGDMLIAAWIKDGICVNVRFMNITL